MFIPRRNDGFGTSPTVVFIFRPSDVAMTIHRVIHFSAPSSISVLWSSSGAKHHFYGCFCCCVGDWNRAVCCVKRSACLYVKWFECCFCFYVYFSFHFSSGSAHGFPARVGTLCRLSLLRCVRPRLHSRSLAAPGNSKVHFLYSAGSVAVERCRSVAGGWRLTIVSTATILFSALRSHSPSQPRGSRMISSDRRSGAFFACKRSFRIGTGTGTAAPEAPR